MNVAILGSQSLNIKEDDIYRYMCNIIHPHPVGRILTTGTEGIAQCAKEMSDKYDLPCDIFETEKDAIMYANFVLVFRSSEERPWIIKMASRKGKLFKEFVV